MRMRTVTMYSRLSIAPGQHRPAHAHGVAVRAETLGKGFRDSVTDMQGLAASRSHRARSYFPGIMGRDKRPNDGGMRRRSKGCVMMQSYL